MTTKKPKQYFTNSWNQTINGAVFYLNKDITFNLDERTYGYSGYNIDAVFNDKEQIEDIFEKTLDHITPYDILELIHAAKNSPDFCISYKVNDEGEVGSFEFEKLTKEKYDQLMSEDLE
jgi:hypothetical protein